MITGIVAVGKNWEIGKKNGLLFSIPADMKHFKETTANSIVVMGENTLLSFPGGKPLKGRTNIVLCPEGHEYGNCICVHSFDGLINILECLSVTNTIYIIGGGMLYKSMLPYYDSVIVTKVDATDSEATVFFPNLDKLPQFEPKLLGSAVSNEYSIEFYNYVRQEVADV